MEKLKRLDIVARKVRVDFGELRHAKPEPQQDGDGSATDPNPQTECEVVPLDWCVDEIHASTRTIRGNFTLTRTTESANLTGIWLVASTTASVLIRRRYGGNGALTEVFHALSITFPVGETFFIDSVMHYAPRLRRDHPTLWKDVQLFFKQEGMHSAVHEAWNERIRVEYGHPMREIEALVDAQIEEGKKRLPYLSQLAVTACLEHWTAGLAHVLLCTESGEQLLSNCAEPYRSLWFVLLRCCHNTGTFIHACIHACLPV